MSFFRAIIIRWGVIPVILVSFTPCASFSAMGVKTSFKKYSLFRYDNRVYLCEPYLVQKDEWLYKIFRRKGEISTSDFPLFLNIFKAINPQLGKIDAISPGSQILIPLKQVDKNDYEQDSNSTVAVPVLAFSTEIKPATLSRHTHKHELKAGDTISKLLSEEFLTPRGNVSKVGEKAILHLNPGITDINCIYQGKSIIIPEPSILSQPWFKDFIAMGKEHAPPADRRSTHFPEKTQTAPHHTAKPISMADLAHLKRYTQLIRGRLMHQGKLFFPLGSHGGRPKFIDLSKTPVISDSTGKKTVLLEPDTTESSMDPDLVATMKAYWKGLQFKKFSDVLNTTVQFNTQTMKDVPKSQESLIRTLLAVTSYAYEPQALFPVSLNKVQMTISLGRITHDHAPDILINPGSVYGSALDVLKHQGYQILDLPSALTFEDICTRLFSRLGYQVWKDPSFKANRKVKNIPGIYAEKGMEKLFLTRTPLFKSATTFLENEKIDVIMLN
ncbi:LysM peptidoglycan-binding domain-containing protein [Desulfobacter vibrioformis]|uniref:LysM peptidoglycan-binding domain-containing protein n=1 Tax=Desulfobacter vibrioformis TaxID=34031 RepID=UPI00055638BB|nr:LysM peptidoglycan-binding domain-containing protein [Desulfobacter vibrioformis]